MNIYDSEGSVVSVASSNPTFNAVSEPAEILSAMKRRSNDSEGAGTYINYTDYNLLTIAHISDLHGDTVRYGRFLKFANDNKKYITVAIETGDLVDIPNQEQFSGMTSEEIYPDVDLLKVVGNHEKNASNVSMTNAQIYNAWNFESPSGGVYYYKDYTDQGIRIIALNSYDTASNSSDWHYTQSQIDWFISALQGAKTNGYGVIVLRHGIESGIPIKNDQGFFQRWWQWYPFWSSVVCNGTPIEDIINAFKNGTSINQTYSYTDGVASITASATFSGNGEFISYLTGHHHADWIGYSNKYPDQLYCGIVCGVCKTAYISPSSAQIWDAVSDLPRIEDEKSQDAFNVYAIDRKNRLVKVLRVGADVNDLLQARKTAMFSY